MRVSPKIVVATIALVLLASVVTLFAIHRTPSGKTSDWNSILNNTAVSSPSHSVPATSTSSSTPTGPPHPASGLSATHSKPTTRAELMVDIKGAVLHPGVYKVLEGDRVIEAVGLAGGLLKEADSSVINMSQHVTDEMVIYVPRKGEPLPLIPQVQPSNANAGSSNTTSSKKMVHLNSASLEEFKTLPGIGPTKAQAIFNYRETNGPFKSLDDLVNVTGIGDKTVEHLKPYLDLN